LKEIHTNINQQHNIIPASSVAPIGTLGGHGFFPGRSGADLGGTCAALALGAMAM